MTQVRGLMWAGLALGSAVLVAVATAVTAPTIPAEPPQIAPSVAAPVAVPQTVVASPISDVVAAPAVIDRRGIPADPEGVGEIAGVVPRTELGEGDATVRLRLLGFEDRQPVAMSVRLWRLGVPESETWTEGDQVQAAIDVGAEGVRIERLPAGRYRVECRDARSNATDPPEFVLADGESTADLRVEHRRSFRLRLRIVGVDGVSIRQARQRLFGVSIFYSDSDSPPPWAAPRAPKCITDFDGHRDGGGGVADGGSGPSKPVLTNAEGFFDLSTVRERGGKHESKWTDEFAADGVGMVRVSMDNATPVDSTYVGIAPRLDVLVAHVVYPDGAKLDPSTAGIEAISSAVRCSWTPPADAWRTIPVTVRVFRDGCAPLKFIWTAATADAEHRLVAKPAGRAK